MAGIPEVIISIEALQAMTESRLNSLHTMTSDKLDELTMQLKCVRTGATGPSVET